MQIKSGRASASDLWIQTATGEAVYKVTDFYLPYNSHVIRFKSFSEEFKSPHYHTVELARKVYNEILELLLSYQGGAVMYHLPSR